jgi:hypothetical protein
MEILTCKHCGLAIKEDTGSSTGYRHLPAINNKEMVTCKWANTRTGIAPSPAICIKYPTEKCSARPCGVKDIEAVKLFIPTLPPITGRKFRE